MSRLNVKKQLNMTKLMEVLGRPQFANIKALALPYHVKLGKQSIKKISNSCPFIETFDVGYYDSIKAKDADLNELPKHFSNLSAVRTGKLLPASVCYRAFIFLISSFFA